MLKFSKLSIQRADTTLINDFNVEIEKGGLIILTGANGSGKSTLLKTLVGLLPITKGEIIINNRAVTNYAHEERARTIAYVNAQKIEEAYIRVIDLVRLGRYPYLKVQHEKALEDVNIAGVLKALSLEAIQYNYLNEISDGELQKSTIARALVQDTPILVMDEPTAFLDYPSKKELFKLLRAMALEKNKVIICATHDVELAAIFGTEFWHLENKVISVSDKSIAWN